jgi:hypothetical protein
MRWRGDRAGDAETKDLRHEFIMAGAVPNMGWLGRCVALGDRDVGFVGKMRPAILHLRDLRIRIIRVRVTRRLPKSSHDRFDRVDAAINGLNQQERSLESIQTGSCACTLASLAGASPGQAGKCSHVRRREDEEPHTEERIREWGRRDRRPQWRIVDCR